MVYSTVPLFWIVIHPNIDAWRRRKQHGKPTYKALLPLWVGMWIAMGAISWPWRNVLLWHSPIAWIPGACCSLQAYFCMRTRGVVSRHCS